MPAIAVKEARARDIAKFTGIAIPGLQFVGLTATENGKPIGLGVIVWGNGGRPFVSLEITERLRTMPFLLHRLAKALVSAGAQACPELYAIEKAIEPTSARWLTRLGFEPTEEMLAGERVWQWRN
ncbi:MAG: hypothetical protein ACRDHG_04860 [Anaerolineales bacterium]